MVNETLTGLDESPLAPVAAAPEPTTCLVPRLLWVHLENDVVPCDDVPRQLSGLRGSCAQIADRGAPVVLRSPGNLRRSAT